MNGGGTDWKVRNRERQVERASKGKMGGWREIIGEK